MPEMIEIEGGLARIVQRELIREVQLKDLMPLIETRVPIVTPVLPAKTKMFRFDPTVMDRWRIQVLIELDPAIRTIPVDGEDHRISMPFTVFFFEYYSTNQGETWVAADYKCFHAKTSVEGEDSWVIPAFVPNVNSEGLICFGNTGGRFPRTLAGQINGTVNTFYLSNFNHFNRTGGIPGNRRTYRVWEKMTNENPDGWRDWPDWGDENGPADNNPHYRIGDLFTIKPVDRTIIHVDGDTIPELRVAPTFGMAEQWWADRTPTQRFRMRRALALFEAAHPENDTFVDPGPDFVEDDDDA